MEVSFSSPPEQADDLSSPKNFSILENRGYLITGPNEDINMLLLKKLGGLNSPSHSLLTPPPQVYFQGKNISGGMEKEIKNIRRHIAYIFRDGTMISNLNIEENLMLPLLFHYPSSDYSKASDKIKKDFLLLGIPDVLDKRPDLIAYNVKKKLAFIRAALLEPSIILVEKPMFNLNEEDRNRIILYLENLKKKGASLIIASRSSQVLDALIDEAIFLENGKPPVFISRNQEEFTHLNRFTHFPENC